MNIRFDIELNECFIFYIFRKTQRSLDMDLEIRKYIYYALNYQCHLLMLIRYAQEWVFDYARMAIFSLSPSLNQPCKVLLEQTLLFENWTQKDECVDSDGQVLGFETLMFAIFDFVESLVENKKFRPAVKSGLADLMYYIVIYMQITGTNYNKV